MAAQGMDTMRPTYMLLPDFSFKESTTIELGTLLINDSDTKQPNPYQPLSSSPRIPIQDHWKSNVDRKPWSWDSKRSDSDSAGILAELSVFVGVGAGLDAKAARDCKLVITSDHMRLEYYRPDQAYIKDLRKDFAVELELAKRGRPPVYLVTGIMIAENPHIEISRGKERSVGGDLSGDATLTAVPLKAKIEAEHATESRFSNTFTQEGPTIVAYELLRLKTKWTGSETAATEHRWALMDDDNSRGANTYLDVQRVSPDVLADDSA